MTESDTNNISKNFFYFVKKEFNQAKNDYNHNGFYFALQPIISTKNVFKDYISNKLQERRERKKTDADNNSEPENLEKRTTIIGTKFSTNLTEEQKQLIRNNDYIETMAFDTGAYLQSINHSFNDTGVLLTLRAKIRENIPLEIKLQANELASDRHNPSYKTRIINMANNIMPKLERNYSNNLKVA